MVRFYTDAEMDEKCKEYRTVPLKLNKLVYGLQGSGENILTNLTTNKILAPPSVNLNLATISNVPLNPNPASQIVLNYGKLYDDVIVNNKSLNEENPLEYDRDEFDRFASEAQGDTDEFEYPAGMDEFDFELKDEPFQEVKRKRKRRTKFQVNEAKEMGGEDFDAPEVLVKEIEFDGDAEDFFGTPFDRLP